MGKLDSPSIEQVLGPARHREELCKDGGGRGQRRPGDQGAPTRTVGMRGLQAACERGACTFLRSLGAGDVLSSLDLLTRTEFRIKLSEKLLVAVL